MRGQLCLACHFEGADPDGAGAADERKWIVADDLRRARELQSNCVVDERANGAELVGDAQDYARRVGAIGDQSGVVRQQRELPVNAGAREGF